MKWQEIYRYSMVDEHGNVVPDAVIEIESHKDCGRYNEQETSYTYRLIMGGKLKGIYKDAETAKAVCQALVLHERSKEANNLNKENN
jgi:hypothetical protein